MSERVTRKLAVLAVTLILALAAPWGASAAPPDSSTFREAAAPAPGLWARLADWLARVWAENGCIVDPDGCADGSGEPDAGSDGDNGCIVDPSGGGCRDGQ